MTSCALITRSLRHYWRTHVGVVLGAVVSTGILTGALIVGDSVRHSLRSIALNRLGRTEFVLTSGERFFQADLADRLAEQLHTDVVPILQTQGVAIARGGQARANGVQVNGVDRRFWELARGSSPGECGPGEAFLSATLATKLNLGPGDELLLRLERPGQLPRDAAFAPTADALRALTVVVKGIVLADQLGPFSLRASQLSALNVFVHLDWLAAKIDKPMRANIALIAEREGADLHASELTAALAQSWKLADAELELAPVPESDIPQLSSNRIFLSPPVAESALLESRGARGLFTYFVNELRHGNRTTPYSFVSAAGTPIVPADMADDEIIVSDWLAEDLAVAAGDTISLSYFALGPMRELEERSSAFRVRAVVPVSDVNDPALTPRFPGLSDAGSCSDWTPGIPVQLDQIREKDEAYWREYRTAPKAFVTLAAAQSLWSNRYGNLTGIRYQRVEPETEEEIRAELRARLSPVALGFRFSQARADGLRAGAESVDFGQLFLGLSFFLIAAAIALTALLFVFGIEQRAEQIGTLLALGFTPGQVQRLLLTEGMLLACLGGLVGSFLGIAYNRVVLNGLASVWQGAVGATTLTPHVQASTIALGGGIGIVVAVLAIWSTIRRVIAQPVTNLQRGVQMPIRGVGTGRWKASAFLAVIAAIAVAVVVANADPGRGKQAAGVFFGAGALMLTAALAACQALLRTMGRGTTRRTMGAAALSVRNCGRRPGRSLTLIGAVACGVFLVVAVAANRHDPTKPFTSAPPEPGDSFFTVKPPCPSPTI